MSWYTRWLTAYGRRKGQKRDEPEPASDGERSSASAPSRLSRMRRMIKGDGDKSHDSGQGRAPASSPTPEPPAQPHTDPAPEDETFDEMTPAANQEMAAAATIMNRTEVRCIGCRGLKRLVQQLRGEVKRLEDNGRRWEQEKEQLARENEQIAREKEQLAREKRRLEEKMKQMKQLADDL